MATIHPSVKEAIDIKTRHCIQRFIVSSNIFKALNAPDFEKGQEKRVISNSLSVALSRLINPESGICRCS